MATSIDVDCPVLDGYLPITLLLVGENVDGEPVMLSAELNLEGVSRLRYDILDIDPGESQGFDCAIVLGVPCEDAGDEAPTGSCEILFRASYKLLGAWLGDDVAFRLAIRASRSGVEENRGFDLAVTFFVVVIEI